MASVQAQSNVSIVIPLAPKDSSWESLLRDLELMGSRFEVHVVGPEKPQNFLEVAGMLQNTKCVWVDSPLRRAQQMNLGAALSSGSFLWFLHADSRLNRFHFKALETSLLNHPKRLHYFYLKFSRGGPALMWLNTLGANIRSVCFKMPWGDQGFCLSKTQFDVLGGFNEELSFAEDHDFVLRWRKQGHSLKSIPRFLSTSARKYVDKGWASATGFNVKYWLQNL